MKIFYFLYLYLLIFSINTYAQDSTYDYSVCRFYADLVKIYYEKANPYQMLGITPQSSPQEIDAAIEHFKKIRSDKFAPIESVNPECAKLIKSLDEVKIFNAVRVQKTQ